MNEKELAFWLDNVVDNALSLKRLLEQGKETVSLISPYDSYDYVYVSYGFKELAKSVGAEIISEEAQYDVQFYCYCKKEYFVYRGIKFKYTELLPYAKK